MYKIYINDTPLYLMEAAKREDIPFPEQDGRLIARYPGSAKFLLNYADMLEKSKRFDSIILYFPDLKKLQDDFLSHYELIEAAGGLVMTPRAKAAADLSSGLLGPAQRKDRSGRNARASGR